jgi:hypothetical protein
VKRYRFDKAALAEYEAATDWYIEHSERGEAVLANIPPLVRLNPRGPERVEGLLKTLGGTGGSARGARSMPAASPVREGEITGSHEGLFHGTRSKNLGREIHQFVRGLKGLADGQRLYLTSVLTRYVCSLDEEESCLAHRAVDHSAEPLIVNGMPVLVMDKTYERRLRENQRILTKLAFNKERQAFVTWYSYPADIAEGAAGPAEVRRREIPLGGLQQEFGWLDVLWAGPTPDPIQVRTTTTDLNARSPSPCLHRLLP